MYSYGDLSGMEKLAAVPCRGVNMILKRRLKVFFEIFRENHPKHVSYHFGLPAGIGENLVNADDRMPEPVSNEMLNEVFGGDDVRNDNIHPNLEYLCNLATQIAEETYNASDSSVQQL